MSEDPTSTDAWRSQLDTLLGERRSFLILVRGATSLEPLAEEMQPRRTRSARSAWAALRDKPSPSGHVTARYAVADRPILPLLLDAYITDLERLHHGRDPVGELRFQSRKVRRDYLRDTAAVTAPDPSAHPRVETTLPLLARIVPETPKAWTLLLAELEPGAIDPSDWATIREIFPSKLEAGVGLAVADPDGTLSLETDVKVRRTLSFDASTDPRFQRPKRGDRPVRVGLGIVPVHGAGTIEGEAPDEAEPARRVGGEDDGRGADARGGGGSSGGGGGSGGGTGPAGRGPGGGGGLGGGGGGGGGGGRGGGGPPGGGGNGPPNGGDTNSGNGDAGTGGASQGQGGAAAGRIPWDLVLQAIGAVAALTAFLAVVGGARVWARLHAANIPETQTLAGLPKDLYVVEGLQTLLVPLLLGAIVALLLYMSRPLGDPVSGSPAAVGSPAAPSLAEPDVVLYWLKRRRPVRVVSDFAGRYGTTAVLALAGAITVGVVPIVVMLAGGDLGLLALLVGVAALVVIAATFGFKLGPRVALAIFGFLVIAAIFYALWLVVEFWFVFGLLGITLLAGWLTLGLVAEKPPLTATLSLFAALAAWSGALLFTATAGARDPELQQAQVHLDNRIEWGYLLGRTADRVLLAQDTETECEQQSRKGVRTTACPRPAPDSEFDRQVLVLDDDDVDHAVIGGDEAVKITGADERDADKVARDPQPAPTPTPEQPEPGPGEPEDPEQGNRKVIQEVRGSIDGVRMRFQVVLLARRGDMLVLEARVVSRDDPTRETEAVTIGDAFDDHRRDRQGTGDNSLDAIRVVDPATSKVYGLARDGRNNCACSNELHRAQVGPGKPFPLVAMFNAPDDASQTVEIMVPGFELLDDVPVD
jgi:hypothetical protein